MPFARSVPAVLVAACLVLCGCHDASPPTGAAATVNGDVIPLGRFYAALSQATATPGRERPTPKEVMAALVDEQLLAQKAVALGLDERPEVAEALQTARTQILAQAYLQRLRERWRSTDESEALAFRRENRQLFDERRMYSFLELTAFVPAAEVPALADRASRARNVQEIAHWLRSRDVRYTLGAATAPSEDIPPSLLERLAGMGEGELTVIETPYGAAVIELVGQTPAPVSEKEAIERVRAMLAEQRMSKLAGEELEALRRRARIAYRFVPELWDGASGRRDAAGKAEAREARRP